MKHAALYNTQVFSAVLIVLDTLPACGEPYKKFLTRCRYRYRFYKNTAAAAPLLQKEAAYCIPAPFAALLLAAPVVFYIARHY